MSIFRVLVYYSVVLFPYTSSYAFYIEDFWERKGKGPKIWKSGWIGTTVISAYPNVPAFGSKISEVYWKWNDLKNDYAVIDVRLCYKEKYNARPIYRCLNVSDTLIGSTTHFNGLSPYGTFRIEFIPSGGNYPILASEREDDVVRVVYTYQG